MQIPQTGESQAVTWITTSKTTHWQVRDGLFTGAVTGVPDVIVRPENTRQTIEGFGACFTELGWTSLAALDAGQRDSIMRELFAPGVGANFTVCRTPLGANDFSRRWFSYDDVPGDFDLDHFSIAPDLETLVPFIHSAISHQPDLQIWASPWSPPAWMKTNRHYAGSMPDPWFGSVDNGLRADQVCTAGTDMFIQEDRYLRAYATYFGRYIDAYRALGINVSMVMPQNEFNSPLPFPSCTWTTEGIARFITHLGPEMARRGVEIFAGTMELPDAGIIETILHESGQHITGVGLQWAGKGAIATIHRNHPDLRVYQTEQECGDGKNDWRYCRYAWTLLKQYLGNGANAYLYWNIALLRGGLSTWGWAQNSLLSVDPAAHSYAFNPEYYLLKHVSHYVKPGAHVVQASSFRGYDNVLAFANPDGSLVLVMQNDMSEAMPVHIVTGGRMVAPVLPADSFNTFVIPAAVPYS